VTMAATLTANYTLEREYRRHYLQRVLGRIQGARLAALVGQLQELSQRDPLTGLANRRALDTQLEELCSSEDQFAAIVIDVDAFKRAGVDLPAANWSWSDFEKVSLALQQKLGMWGMGSQTRDNQLWGAVYLSTGQWRYTADGSKIGYERDKPFADYLGMLVRMQKANTVVPRADEMASFNQDTSVELSPIVTRKAAMAYFWSNQIVAVWKAAGGDERNFMLHPLPRVPGGKSANFIKPSQFFSVTTQAKAPKEAAMFIDFVTNSLEAEMRRTCEASLSRKYRQVAVRASLNSDAASLMKASISL